METSPSLTASLDPRTQYSPARAELWQIDQSTRPATLLFVSFSLFWLFVGTVLALVASWKMHTPDFLGSIEWLTFGRVRPAHMNTVVYGWGVNAAFAVNLWLMARLCRTQLLHAGTIYVACAGWNLGVLGGTIGILRGDATSIEWLEFPAYVTPLLFFSYALIGTWGILMFRYRRVRHTYVSQWFLLAAFFWFPWLYSGA